MDKRIISFALGNIWSWIPSRNMGMLVDYTRQLDISGLEITLASKEELFSFHLSEENRTWLRALAYVSIHAPFRLRSESADQEELLSQLHVLSELYQSVNARNIIIHPDEMLEPELLQQQAFAVSTENMPEGRFSVDSNLKHLMSHYPGIGICIDVSHAFLKSGEETARLINAFGKKISQIHLSGADATSDHLSFRNVSKEFLRSIRPIKALPAPIVIEADIRTTSIQYLREEIEYIKDFLCNA
jgi:hypothetical protein